MNHAPPTTPHNLAIHDKAIYFLSHQPV